MGILASIREAAAEVARRSRHVRIDAAPLDALAAGLAEESAAPAQLDPAHHHRGSEASTLAYILCLDAVNFGSGWFPLLAKRPGCSGYFTIATCLAERFDARGPLGAAELRAVSPADCAALFEQASSPPEVGELMALFARAWNDLGALLGDEYGDRFEALVEDAGGRAERLVEILDRMPLFRDVSEYDGLRVPFYKRAQLAAADLSVAFEGRGPGHFRDLDALTLFADNLVPHVLRREGVLRYEPELARRVDAGELIEAGSPEEVEIRANAVHAVERMVAVLAERSCATTAQRLDDLLWNRGQRPEIKAHPRHRTRTPCY